MTLEVNEVEYCKLAVSFEAGSELIAEKRGEVLHQFKNVKVPGFRKGKATTQAIKLRFKKEIEDRVQQELANLAYQTAVSEKSIKPLGNPHFSAVSLTPDKFTCEFTLQKQPDFELAEYKNFEIPKPQGQMSAMDLTEKILQQVRTQNGESVPYGDDDFVQMGDSAIVDYEVTMEGVVVEDLAGTKEVITIGQSPVAAFDENMLGTKSGETREFDIVGPEAAPEPYRGKNLHFKVTLVMGSRIIPAALDDNLAKKLKLETLDDLRLKASSIAGGRVAEYEKQAIAQQVQKRLVENHPFKLPDWIVTAEAKMQAQNSKLDWETLSDEERQSVITRAAEAVKLSFVLEKIREKEVDAQLSDEETIGVIRENLEKLSSKTENESVESLLTKMTKSGMLPVLIGRVRDEHTLHYVVRTSKIVE